MNEEEFKAGDKKAVKTKPRAANPALRDHTIFSPPAIPEPIEIKEGDDLDKLKIPPEFHQSLVTEGVMKG